MTLFFLSVPEITIDDRLEERAKLFLKDLNDTTDFNIEIKINKPSVLIEVTPNIGSFIEF